MASGLGLRREHAARDLCMHLIRGSLALILLHTVAVVACTAIVQEVSDSAISMDPGRLQRL